MNKCPKCGNIPITFWQWCQGEGFFTHSCNSCASILRETRTSWIWIILSILGCIFIIQSDWSLWLLYILILIVIFYITYHLSGYKLIGGAHLRLDFSLSFYEAIFGCDKEIEFTHLELISPGKLEPETKKIKMVIPAGVDQGTRLRVSQEGDMRSDGKTPGDLYIYLEIPPSSGTFTRDGMNIVSEFSITDEQASLGTEVSIKTIDGDDISLTIPPGIVDGKCLTIEGRGVPKLGSPDVRGDHIVRLKF